jgi:hypothetical protein
VSKICRCVSPDIAKGTDRQLPFQATQPIKPHKRHGSWNQVGGGLGTEQNLQELVGDRFEVVGSARTR